MLTQVKEYLKGEVQLKDEIYNYCLLNLDEGLWLWKESLKLRMHEGHLNRIRELYEFIQMNPQYQGKFIVNEDRLSQYLMILRLLLNLLKSDHENLEERVYTQILPLGEFVIDKLLVLGQVALVSQYLIENNKEITRRKVQKYILSNRSENIKCDEDLAIEVILSAKRKVDVFQSIPKTQNLFDRLALVWSSKEFIINSSEKISVYVSNVLSRLLDLGITSPKIHQGIEQRLDMHDTKQREIAMHVWSHYVKSLGLPPDEIRDSLDEEEIIESQVKIQIVQPKSTAEDQDFIDFEEEDIQQIIVANNIYDCILALQSDDSKRTTEALKCLPYLIRKLDTRPHLQTLAKQFMLYDDHYEMREKCLTSLIIMHPKQTAEIMYTKYFSDDCSLGDRHRMLKTIQNAVQELSDNPKAYPIEDLYTNDNQSFHFKEIRTSYYNKPESTTNRPKPQSRRWIKPRLQLESYENRFHSLTEAFYYPLLINSAIKHKLMLTREQLLLQNLLQTITKMLDCSQNNYHLKKLIEEAIDFLDLFNRQRDPEIIRAKLRLSLKISVILKKEIVVANPDLIKRILSHLDTICTNDEQSAHLMKVLMNNYRSLFEITL